MQIRIEMNTTRLGKEGPKINARLVGCSISQFKRASAALRVLACGIMSTL